MASQQIDANHKVITSNDAFLTYKAFTPTGVAGNGAVGTVNIFTITGTVLCRAAGMGIVDLVSAGGGTVALGISGNANAFITATTATDIDAGEGWVDATPSTGENLVAQHKIMKDVTVVITVATGDVTAGQTDLYMLWRPLSPGAKILAA